MRFVRPAAILLLTGIAATGTAAALVASHREASFDAQAAALSRTWTQDLAAGVPASGITPLQNRLRSQRPPDQWWSPVWLTTDGSGLLQELRGATASAYTAAMSVPLSTAQAVLTAWQHEVSQDRQWIPAAEVAAGPPGAGELRTPTTPDQVTALAAAWQRQLGTTRNEVLAAQQQARIDADVRAVGGPTGLLSQAQAALSRARADNLDPGDVAALISQLQSEAAAGAPLTQTSDRLYAALQQLDQLFSLNDQLNGELRPLELLADQAAAESTPNAASLMSRYQTLDQAYLAGTTYTQLSGLQAQVSGLQSAIQSELDANQCAHSVGSGKVITISISLQEMVMYDGGCVVNATPVTTGRPGFNTPTGYFHVFYKQSPFHMITEYPPGSPGWYPPTWVQRVMEFDVGGYFIHDAFWENQSAFGPGSEFDVAQDWASHGCVHVPNSMMPWLYDWTPLGTPVIISA
jgi:hypothetical protein